MLLNWNNNFWAWLRWCPSLLLSKLYPLRNEGKGKGEEDNEQNVQVMVSSTKNHEERSIRDIMNNNLYKNEVKRIQETFSSVECYLNSFVVPLIEEMRTDLRSAMTNLPFAPAREILEIQISKNFHPPKALSYILKLKKSVNIFNVYEPEVGDLKQLPAMVKSKICEGAGFGRSLFERLVKLGHSKHLRNVQYRMHPSISLFPNKEFYGNQIRNGRNVTQRAHERHFLKEKLFGSYSFINVTNGKEEFDCRNSLKNVVEASVVAEVVSKLYKESMKHKEKVRVGCISPYKGQVLAIQDSLGKTYSSDAKQKFSVNVGSVDGFQGGEEDIIIISTVRCNGTGKIGFVCDLRRANVALTRARYCLWILGSAATLVNSGSVWKRVVVDAKNRGCFHNAYEDDNLLGAMSNALIEIGQQRSLFTADSILFKAAKWKVCFSPEFLESITRYGDSETEKEVASLLKKLSSGWREQRKDEGGSSQVVEWYAVKGPLRLVWCIDVVREKGRDSQVIKVVDIVPISKVAQVAKKLDGVVGEYTVNQLQRCMCKRNEGGVMVPMSWAVDGASSRSSSSYCSNDLGCTQIAAISHRNGASSRNAKSSKNHFI